MKKKKDRISFFFGPFCSDSYTNLAEKPYNIDVVIK